MMATSFDAEREQRDRERDQLIAQLQQEVAAAQPAQVAAPALSEVLL